MAEREMQIADELDAMDIDQWVDIEGTMVYRESERIYEIDDQRLVFIEAYDYLTAWPPRCPGVGCGGGTVRILKRYFDERTWEEVPPEEAEDSLRRFYLDAGPVMESLKQGETIYTDVAEYRAADDLPNPTPP